MLCYARFNYTIYGLKFSQEKLNARSTRNGGNQGLGRDD
jgi:hypothetical protein